MHWKGAALGWGGRKAGVVGTHGSPERADLSSSLCQLRDGHLVKCLVSVLTRTSGLAENWGRSNRLERNSLLIKSKAMRTGRFVSGLPSVSLKHRCEGVTSGSWGEAEGVVATLCLENERQVMLGLVVLTGTTWKVHLFGFGEQTCS